MKSKVVVYIWSLLMIIVLCCMGSLPVSAQKQENNDYQYKIGVVDLMILKRQKISALPLAASLGADGVEVDMGGLGDRPNFANKLADPVIRKAFLDSARVLGIEISSLAMTGFYSQSFATRDDIELPIHECINTMVMMGVKVGFLPLGVEGDLVKFPERREAIVQRLKMAGEKALAAGVVIGIETSLSAEDEIKLLDEIGSPAIKICFNFSNPLSEGRNLYNELEILGGDRICEVHCTNKDGVWLQNDPDINMKKIKKILDRMAWSGWLVVERSRDASKPHDVEGNYGANIAYLKSIFQR